MAADELDDDNEESADGEASDRKADTLPTAVPQGRASDTLLTTTGDSAADTLPTNPPADEPGNRKADTLPTSRPLSHSSDTLLTATGDTGADTLPTSPPQHLDPAEAVTLPLQPPADHGKRDAATLATDVSAEPETSATINSKDGGYRRNPSKEMTLQAQDMDAPGTGALRRHASATHRRTSTILADADSIIRGTAVTVRVNPRLPRDTQQLDEHLQLSRHSVYVQMLQQRGSGDLPQTVRLKLESQDTIGRYTVERPLAAGGMGAVLAICDEDFNRRSAMKVMHARFAHQAESLERFLEEAQITAQLEHPNIVPVHDVGMTADGTLFYTMKLIQGQSLASVVHKRRDGDAKTIAEWSDERVMLCFLKVLEGMSYAHSHGVIHRDIKPDNIMIEEHGEVLVVDWGIAKVLAAGGGIDEIEGLDELVRGIRAEDSLSATHTGTAIGTPYYMPPEQATGNKTAMGPRSDIYALGVTLYELLTLERPITAETVPAMLPMIISGSAKDIKQCRPDLHDDLAAIVHKAMACEPERRYESCEAFADDLQRYLTGRAVAARSRNWVERLGAWIKAHRRQVQVSAALLLVAVLGIAGTIAWQASANRARAEKLLATVAEGLEQDGDADSLQALRAALIEARTLQADHPQLPALTEALAARQLSLELNAARHQAAEHCREGRALLADAEQGYADLPQLDRAAVLAAKGDIAAFLDRCRLLVASPDGLLNQAGQAFRAARETGAPLPQGIDDDLRRLGALVQDVEARQSQALQLATDYNEAGRLLTDARSLQAAGHSAEALAKVTAADARFLLPGSRSLRSKLEQDIADAELARLRREAIAARDRLRETLSKAEALPAADQQRPELIDRAAEALNDASRHSERGILPDDVAALGQQLAVLRERSELARRQAANLREARHKAAIALATARQAAETLPAIDRRISDLQAVLDQELMEGTDSAAHHSQLLKAQEERLHQASLMRRSARQVLDLLTGHPQEADLVAAHELLADDALASLRQAKANNDPVAAELALNLLALHDRDGSRRAALQAPGRLRIDGQARLALPLHAGSDTRLGIDDSAPPQSPVDAVFTLSPGAWRIGDQSDGLIWQITPGSDGTLHIPEQRSISIDVPGVKAPIEADYVPAADGSLGIWLGRYEISNLQYYAFVHDQQVFERIREHDGRLLAGENVGAYPLVPGDWKRSPALDEGPISKFVIDREQALRPVADISQRDAMAFCDWLSQKSGRRVRLPWRTEWQLAAAAADPNRRWTWGPVFDPSFCISAHDGIDRAARVGSRDTDRGPYGHYDLAGNLREWLLDSERTADNFHGALVAGGGWGDHLPERFATDAVESVPPEARYPVFGFRVCIEPLP